MNDSIGQRFPVGLKALTATAKLHCSMNQSYCFTTSWKNILLEILKPMWKQHPTVIENSFQTRAKTTDAPLTLTAVKIHSMNTAVMAQLSRMSMCWTINFEGPYWKLTEALPSLCMCVACWCCAHTHTLEICGMRLWWKCLIRIDSSLWSEGVGIQPLAPVFVLWCSVHHLHCTFSCTGLHCRICWQLLFNCWLHNRVLHTYWPFSSASLPVCHWWIQCSLWVE